MTKRKRFLVLSLCATFLLAGCGSQMGAEASGITDEGFTTEYAYAKEDTDAEWNDATTVAFDGNDARIIGTGALFSEGTLTIGQAGTYVLSGALDDGQILIDAGKKDTVRLVLQGVSLRHETGPAIYAPQSGKVVLILPEGTESSVSDGTGYADIAGSDAPDAAIYVQDDLSITGSGALSVTGAVKHGIRAQDYLAVTGGTIRVTAVGDALRGRDGVAIQGGDLTLIAEGDGIQSNNADDDASGFVLVEGGTLSILAGNDGIQAESALTIRGGDFQITTGGGSASAPVREEDFPGGRSGRGAWGGVQTIEAPQTTEEASVSKKALKAGKLINITGGTFDIDAEDDAIHSNDAVLITAGDFSIQTGDDGFHADAALEIHGGTIDLSTCYEGIEGLSVTVFGGSISIVASDDAINAAGGADSASPAGGPMGWDRFASNGDIFVRISGGTLDLYAPHDGIDSNGDVFMDGGMIRISAPSAGMEGAIDLDGRLTVTGGELITAGSVASVSSETTQPVLLVSYGAQKPSGSVISIQDANGNTVLSYTSKTAYALSGFTSPAFSLGEAYTLCVDGERVLDVRLDAILTSIGSDGGAYGGGFDRGGGGRRGGF